MPIFDHEDLLKYNPRAVKMMNIYDGQYVFGNEVYDGILSSVAFDKDLPFFKLDNDYQMFTYECPAWPMEFKAPDYTEEADRQSRLPDMRHTLYWNPSARPASGDRATFTFFTSDLEGEFQISVEGLTAQGQIVRATSDITVGGC